MIFIDTNLILRFLLKEPTPQQQEAQKLFETAAEGKIKLISSTIVFFEIYWVLSSFYQKRKHEIVDILVDILKMRFIHFDQGEILRKATKFYKQENISLEDAYNLFYAKDSEVAEFKTFDKKLDRFYKQLAKQSA